MYLKIMDLRVGSLDILLMVYQNKKYLLLEQILFTICVSKDMKFERVGGSEGEPNIKKKRFMAWIIFIFLESSLGLEVIDSWTEM